MCKPTIETGELNSKIKEKDLKQLWEEIGYVVIDGSNERVVKNLQYYEDNESSNLNRKCEIEGACSTPLFCKNVKELKHYYK